MVPTETPQDLQRLTHAYQDLSRAQKSYFQKETVVWMLAILGTLTFDAFVLMLGVKFTFVVLLIFGLWIRSMNPKNSLFKGSRKLARQQEDIEKTFAQRGLHIEMGPDGQPQVYQAESDQTA